MQNVVRIHAIEPKIELSQEMWENEIAAPPAELYVPKLHHCYF